MRRHIFATIVGLVYKPDLTLRKGVTKKLPQEFLG